MCAMSSSLGQLEAARTALLAYDGAAPGGDGRLAAAPALSVAEEAEAIQLLDAAGAIDAVLDCDFAGNRRWRVRAVTSAGRDLARLLHDERVWACLRAELAEDSDPIGHLVRSCGEASSLA